MQIKHAVTIEVRGIDGPTDDETLRQELGGLVDSGLMTSTQAEATMAAPKADAQRVLDAASDGGVRHGRGIGV